jgi:hypothetical protein
MEMDIYMRRRLVALGGLVAFFIIIVLLIKSCGGDDEPAPLQSPTAGTTDEAGAVPLSTEDFITQADEICGPANAAVGALDPEDPNVVRDEYRITADELSALQELQVEDESRVLQQFFAALEDVVAALRDKQRAVQAGDTAAEGEAQIAIDEAEIEARELGTRYGFEECGQFLDAGQQPGGGGGEAATGTEPVEPTDTGAVPVEPAPTEPTDTGAAPTEPAPTEPTTPPEDSGGGISP